MSGRYLTDLADVVRGAGLNCREYEGWQTRARGSGGYTSGRPTHVMAHHTASPRSWDGQRDADYCAEGDEDAPLSNLYLDRSGLVWILAAGCTNTNGKGRDSWGGGVPDNSMNSYAIGIEAGNEGTGEPWPTAQVDAYICLVAALSARYGIANHCVRGHWEWAPDRKVDPAGTSPYASGGASWDMDAFRAACASGTLPPPLPPPPEEDDMAEYIIGYAGADTDGAMYASDMHTKTWLRDAAAVAGKETMIALAGGDSTWRSITDRELFRAYGPILGPRPEHCDDWGLPT